VKFVFDLVFGQDILEYSICHEVQVQTERVSSWVPTLLLYLLCIWYNHSVIGSEGVGDTCAKGLSENAIIRCQNAALVVNVELGRRDSLTQSNLLALEVLDGYLVSLIPARPYDYISVFQMRSLSLGRLSLDQLYPFFIALCYPLVQALSITSKAGEGVEEPVLVAEAHLLEVGIPVEFGVLYSRIEHLYLVSVQNFDIGTILLEKVMCDTIFLVVVVPVLEVEPSTTLACALTTWSSRALLLL